MNPFDVITGPSDSQKDAVLEIVDEYGSDLVPMGVVQRRLAPDMDAGKVGLAAINLEADDELWMIVVPDNNEDDIEPGICLCRPVKGID